MTMPDDKSMDALHEMLAERSRYEGWLAQLDQKRSSTPLHVLERVRADYTARLESVTTQLRGRAVDLEATVAALQTRLDGLAKDEELRRDERAETELRSSVGELSDEAANDTISACDEAINSLVAQRQSVGEELSTLKGVLVRVLQAPATPAPVAEDLVSVDALAPTGDHVAVAPTPPPAPAPRQAPSPAAAEELEFLRSVVSPSAEETHQTPQNAQAPASAQQSNDLLQPPPLAAPRRATPIGNASAIRDPLRAVAGEASLTPGNMPAFLKDIPSEQVKTLKCQECGTMNYPTEWYCEKCGGELAAM